MGHAAANHGAEGRIVEPAFWIVCSFVICISSGGRVVQWWGRVAWTGWGGLWGDVRVTFCVIFKCVVVAVGGIVGLLVSSCSAARLPGGNGGPVIRLIWEQRGGVEEALNQLTPVFLVRSFVNPAAEGAMAVDLDCGYVLE